MLERKLGDIILGLGGIVLIGTLGAGLILAFSSSPKKSAQFPPSQLSAQQKELKQSAKRDSKIEKQDKDEKPSLIAAQPIAKIALNTSLKNIHLEENSSQARADAAGEEKNKNEPTEITQELKRVSLGKEITQQDVIAVLSSHHMMKCQEKKIACQKIELSFLPMKQSFDLWQDVSEQNISPNMIEIRPIALDPEEAIAQLLISGKLDQNIVGFFWYGTKEAQVPREWHLMPIPYTYKGILPEIISGKDGVAPVLRVRDLEFAKLFVRSSSAERAENFAPLKLLRFEKGHFIITWNHVYRAVFLQDLRTHLPPKKDNKIFTLSNEWLSYYVATLTMMGHFQQAWAYMLLHRDVKDKDFVNHLRAVLLKDSLISKEEFKEAPLHYAHLAKKEKKYFKEVNSLFDMLPASERQLLLQ